MSRQLRVLVVDDSAIIRSLLTRILSSDPEIEVCGAAADPYVARDMIAEHKPDVVTLDLEMPRMDGVAFLQKLMRHYPTRVVVCSSLTEKDSETALQVLRLGAVDVIHKPTMDPKVGLASISQDIIMKVKSAARARLIEPQLSAPSGSKVAHLGETTYQMIAIAASTGGTTALREVLSGLPADIPGIVIVQHIPQAFTEGLAKSLSEVSRFPVRVAKEGDQVSPGMALLAPGGMHMEVHRAGAFYRVKLHEAPLRHGVRPAADYLFESIAKHSAQNTVGLVLTGMGKDGAEGLLRLKENGSYTVVQSERTCVVYGMPKECVAKGAVEEIVDLPEISGRLIEILKKMKVRGNEKP